MCTKLHYVSKSEICIITTTELEILSKIVGKWKHLH